MTHSLELKVATALTRWRLIERALHDTSSTWSLEYNGVSVPVLRFLRDDRVSFAAYFPAMCPIVDPELTLLLKVNEETVRVMPMDEPLSEDGCKVWWDLRLLDSVPVE